MRLGLILLCLLQLSCNVYQSLESFKNEIKETGYLKLVTRNSLATYYADRDDAWTGFEYDMAKAFAKSLGVKLKVEMTTSADTALALLDESRNTLVGAGLSLTQKRRANYRFSEPYLKIRQKVVCHRFEKQAKNRKDLLKVRILVGTGTSYEKSLKNLKKILPELNWEARAINSEQALYEVNQKKADCTIVDSHILALQQRIYPNLKAMFDLSPVEGVRWFVPKKNYHLERLANEWIKKNQNLVLNLQERHFGYLKADYDYYDRNIFRKRIESRLPKWKKLFKKAAKRTGLDWRLIAALSYQESHWNNAAVSPTGVRGLMMLTRATARRMKISSRLDPNQSVMAGAKYFKILKRNLKSRVPESDITWLALAAYNVGLGHIYDVCDYLKSKDRESTWRNVKEILPLLSKESFFKNLKYGYANGNEPLVYVDHIRDFYQILKLQ